MNINCPKCKNINIKQYNSENYSLNNCETCGNIFNNLQFDMCCKKKNLHIIQFNLENGWLRKQLCCINCLKTVGSPLKKNNVHKYHFNYEERQKIRQKFNLEYTELHKSIPQKHFYLRYLDYLQSNKWNLKRNEILKRDNYKCKKCMTNINLQIHHLNYNNLYNESNDELITLCKNCHENEHKNKPNLYEIL